MQNLFEKVFKVNIFKNGLLRNLLIIAIILVIILPLLNYLVIRPSFEKFLTQCANDEAARVAKHFVAMFIPKKTILSRNTIGYYISGVIENLKSDFGLAKLKIFSNSGEIIFSTDPGEVGKLNNQRYFHEVVAKGKVITKAIQKEAKSLEGQLMSIDVVETYMPLMIDGNFGGAFEIYYDITAKKQKFDNLLSRSSVLMLIVALGLSLSVIITLFIEKRTISKRKQAEKERDQLIADLKDTVTNIKTLRGLLPICTTCKKIRDDKEGCWKHIESYIGEHSEAKFTHSMCPRCAKKFYPELFQD